MTMIQCRYIFEAMETLLDALVPYVERRLREVYDSQWRAVAADQIVVRRGILTPLRG